MPAVKIFYKKEQIFMAFATNRSAPLLLNQKILRGKEILSKNYVKTLSKYGRIEAVLHDEQS